MYVRGILYVQWRDFVCTLEGFCMYNGGILYVR